MEEPRRPADNTFLIVVPGLLRVYHGTCSDPQPCRYYPDMLQYIREGRQKGSGNEISGQDGRCRRIVAPIPLIFVVMSNR